MSLPQRAELPLGLLLLLPAPSGVLPVTSLGNSSCPALLAQPRGEAWAAAGSVQPPPGTQAFWPISLWTGGWARAGGWARGTLWVQRGWRKPRKEGPASLGRCLLGGPLKVYSPAGQEPGLQGKRSNSCPLKSEEPAKVQQPGWPPRAATKLSVR